MTPDDPREDAEVRSVRQLMAQVSETHSPTALERERIERAMQAAFREVGPAESPRRLDRAEIIVLEDEAAARRSRKWGAGWRLGLLGAACLIVIVAVLANREGSRVDDLQVTLEDGQTVVEANLADTFVAMRAPSLVVERSGDSFVAVRVPSVQLPTPLDVESMRGLFIVAQPETLFDDMDPEAWFDLNGVLPQRLPSQDEGVVGWSLTIGGEGLAAAGCIDLGPCLPFADLGADDPLMLHAGALNTIHLLEGSEGEPPVVFMLVGFGGAGAGDDVLTRFRRDIVTDIEPYRD